LSGEILDVMDQGSVWLLLYKRDGDGPRVLGFEWRQFANMYEIESGRSFASDYNLGRGREAIETYFKGRRIWIAGEPFDERVWFE